MAHEPGRRKNQAPRRYQTPVTSIQSMRAMRMVNGIRDLIVTSAIEEEELDVLGSTKGQREFVSQHRQLQRKLAGHFPFIDVRKGRYASDIAAELAKDIVFYILHGDTPGGS